MQIEEYKIRFCRIKNNQTDLKPFKVKGHICQIKEFTGQTRRDTVSPRKHESSPLVICAVNK